MSLNPFILEGSSRLSNFCMIPSKRMTSGFRLLLRLDMSGIHHETMSLKMENYLSLHIRDLEKDNIYGKGVLVFYEEKECTYSAKLEFNPFISNIDKMIYYINDGVLRLWIPCHADGESDKLFRNSW